MLKGGENFFVDLLVIVISVVLSTITYKYVENPFRNKSIVSDKKLVAFAGISFILIASIAVVGYKVGNDFVVDPTGEINLTYQEAITAPPNRKRCFEKVRTTGEFYSCELSGNNNSKAKKLFVWGDSHGSAFIPVLRGLSRKNATSFSNNSGCPPVINIKRTDFSQSCQRINKQIFDHIMTNNYDLVILVAAFSNYLNWGIVGELDAEHNRDPESSQKDFEKLISETLGLFDESGIPFLVIVQPPRMDNRIPEEFIRSETQGIKYLGERIQLSEYEKQIAPLLNSIPRKWHDNLVGLKDIYCPNEECISMKDGVILYKDKHHISNAYAEYLSDFFTPIIERKLNMAGKSI
jgi:hypothetical protein